MRKALEPIALQLRSTEHAEGLARGIQEVHDLAMFLQDVNDHAPECEPPFQELTVHTSLGRSMEVTKVSCRIPQEPQRLAFSYSIVGGEDPGCHQAVGGMGKASSASLLSPLCFQGIVRANSACEEPSWCTTTLNQGPPGQNGPILTSY